MADHDIFLSYSRRDLVVVEQFRQQMEAGGYRLWFDKKKIRTGDNWKRALAVAIDEAQVLIWMVSRESCESPVVRKEVEHAIAKGKGICMIYLEPFGEIRLPPEIEFELGNVHAEVLDPETLAIPPNLVESLAEMHDIRPRAFHEKRSNDPIPDRNLDHRLDQYAKLIDRAGHQDEFQEKLLGDAEEIAPDAPVLVVVHGPQDQLVPDFRASLASYHLPCYQRRGLLRIPFDVDSDVHVRQIGAQALKKASPTDFDNHLCQAFLKRTGSRERVINHLARDAEESSGRLKVITFRLSVKNDRASDAVRFFKSFLKYWQKFPPIENLVLLVKLEITYSGRRAKIVPFLEKTLPRLARKCDRCFLPALGDVDEGEADGWVDDNEDVRNFLIHELGFTEGEVRRHIHEAFKDAGNEELPMADLEPSVRGRLKDAYRSRQALQ